MDIQNFIEKTETASHWKRIGIRHHHGICVPLFSLRSQKSCGIGDFGDLLGLIDWCKQVGFDCIQLLPINDSGEDPSPYYAISSCAIDPIYMNLRDLPDSGNLAEELSIFSPLNDLPRLPHLEVRHQKMRWLYRYFEKTFPSIKDSKEFQTFHSENPWLVNYCIFKSYKDEYGGKNWEEWPPEKRIPNIQNANPRSVDLHRFLQFHAFRQMEKVKRYANEKGIFLKGDLPILLSPDSADVWAYRSQFNLKYVAGAPPDYYNPLGQKWGFPLFDWAEMRKTNFEWWKNRLQIAEKFFHIYRIDHVVGFFRIWAMRPQEKPALGRYIPSDPQEWKAQGQEILKMMIHASPLLPMAEDLGSIPEIVYETLHQLGICGTKVIRWWRQWEKEEKYIPIQDYDPISLTTVSTHDSETVALWWKKYPIDATKYAAYKHWVYENDLAAWQLKEILYDSHHSASLFHINLLQEYLALFPKLISSNLEDERINVPGTLLPTNWTYRFKPTIEELASNAELIKEIQSIIR